ncbi:MAG: multidrug effflux MFS transporter [Burkholderiales bacterium]|nr:multidrug effflux MFS transporter [Burkholderiales bacterium]
MPSSNPGAPRAAAGHSRIALELTLLLAALTAFAPLAIDMYLPALPELRREFQTSPATAQLSLSAFFVGMASGQLFYGALSDRFGRKLPLAAGLVLFIIATVGCALAGSVQSLIGWRFVQALGVGATAVIPRAMVRDLFDPRDGARVLSRIMMVMGVAPILAPMLGAQLLLVADWRAIFWALAALGALVLAAVLWRLQDSHPGNAEPLRLGRVLGRHFALLADRHMLRYGLGGGVAIGALFAYIAGAPFVFIEHFGLSPQSFTLLFGVNAAGLIGASSLNGALLGRVKLHRMLRLGVCLQAAAGLVLIAFGVLGFGGLWGVVLPLFVVIACLGLVLPNSTVLCMAPYRNDAGVASGLLGVMQYAVAAVTSALVSALHDGSPRSMALVAGACAVLGLLLLFPRPGALVAAQLAVPPAR